MILITQDIYKGPLTKGYDIYMTITNHIGTGALIGLTVANPVFAVPMALLSHFVLDALPHFGYKGEGGYGFLFKHKLARGVTYADIVIAIIVAAMLLRLSPVALLIGIIALSPDIMWPIRYMVYERKGKMPPEGYLSWFHWHIQKYERPWGLGVEAVYLLVIIYLLKNSIRV